MPEYNTAAQLSLAHAAAPRYTYDQPASCGTWCYDDPSFTKLTDGVAGDRGRAYQRCQPHDGGPRAFYTCSGLNVTTDKLRVTASPGVWARRQAPAAAWPAANRPVDAIGTPPR